MLDLRMLMMMDFISIRLNSGWSFHTCRSPTRTASSPINRVNSPASANAQLALRDEELERIKKVLERAQRIDVLEQERVG